MATNKNVKNILRKNKPIVVKRFKFKKPEYLDLRGLSLLAISLVIIIFLAFSFFSKDSEKENSSSIIQSGVEALELGNFNEAGVKFEKVLRKESNNLDAIYQLAIVKYRRKEYDEAIRDLNVVTKMNPESKDPYNILGNIYRDLGNNEEAIKNYNRAIQKDPNFISSYIYLIVFFMDINKKEEAMLIVNDGLNNNPNNPRLERMKAILEK